jgi:hypothetical protein
MSLESATTALKRALDKLEHPERPSTPPPPVELGPDRVEAIATVLLRSNAIVSLAALNGVSIGELAAFCRRAKG